MTKWKLPDYLGGGELEGLEYGSVVQFDVPGIAAPRMREQGFVLPKSILTEVVSWPAGTFFVDDSDDAWIVDKDPRTATELSGSGERSNSDVRINVPLTVAHRRYGPLTRLVPESTKDTP